MCEGEGEVWVEVGIHSGAGGREDGLLLLVVSGRKVGGGVVIGINGYGGNDCEVVV